ncbi:hypothetical protein Fmac_025533 [Flemingia macrophylla]|uniref:pectinesterase n=1 Tax=Flemingia macrophylla TaxID=520843 RepID=A0ABD1LSG7_9FABA
MKTVTMQPSCITSTSTHHNYYQDITDEAKLLLDSSRDLLESSPLGFREGKRQERMNYDIETSPISFGESPKSRSYPTLTLITSIGRNLCESQNCVNPPKTIIVSQSCTANFKIIQSAIDFVSAENSQWVRIQISPGTYKEQVLIPMNKQCIYLEGAGSQFTRIEYLNSQAKNIIATGITFTNTLNNPVDDIEITQATAAWIEGDKCAFFNCSFLGVQDTLYDKLGRHYYHNCYIKVGLISYMGMVKQSLRETMTFVEEGNIGPGADESQRVKWMKHINGSQLNQFLDISFIDNEGWIAKDDGYDQRPEGGKQSCTKEEDKMRQENTRRKEQLRKENKEIRQTVETLQQVVQNNQRLGEGDLKMEHVTWRLKQSLDMMKNIDITKLSLAKSIANIFKSLGRLLLESVCDTCKRLLGWTHLRAVPLIACNVGESQNCANPPKVIYVSKSSFKTVQSAIDSVPAGNTQWIHIQISAGNTFNHPIFGETITQAYAAQIQADKCAFFNCAFIGVQDTLYDQYGRHYYHNCYIRGGIDFIFGNGQSIFEASIIYYSLGRYGAPRQGSITAQERRSPYDTSGFVFKRCTISGTEGIQTLLGRSLTAYARVIVADSYLSDVIAPEGWSALSYGGHE